MKNAVFEVNESDISALSDEGLTDLIARLCRADVTRAGQSTSCVRHGGDINTPDSGLDIVVEWEKDPPLNSHIPRLITGIQVKKPDMPRSSILMEMGKNIGEGKSINKLINKKGAYIIASSGRSCNAQQLRKREDAMREAVSNIPNNEDLRLVFYSIQSIADWVNEYPGVVLWVRNTVGRSLSGWEPYGDWARSGSVTRYFLDDKLRFKSGLSEQGTTVLEGIQKIREKLSMAGSTARLVGLSGVGKTRLIQALFEITVGANSLPEHLACYTDSGENPNLNVLELVRTIRANDQRIILIVDNCAGDVHTNLVNNIKGSQISLITVEYDVQDDQPVGTQVFWLEPASEKVLKAVLQSRNPDIDNNVLDKIVELSDGNSRVALALVENFKEFGDFGTLRDNQIFNRLFWQKNSESLELLHTAQACSLVFSFNSSDPSKEESEIPPLASLIDQTHEVFYRNLSEIKKRKLLQSRGNMSAILPQAVANKIANNALDSFTKNALTSAFFGPKSDRLLKSYCHRLSFLHNSPKARELAKDLLSPTGLLGGKGINLNETDIRNVTYLLPICFEESLNYLERMLALLEESTIRKQHNRTINWIAGSLLDLAYFEENFEMSMNLLERLIISLKISVKLDEGVKEQTKHLFWAIFSRTETSPSTRQNHILALLKSKNKHLFTLGVDFLNSTFQTDYFAFVSQTEFGARHISRGYNVFQHEQSQQWFSGSLLILTNTINTQSDMRPVLLSMIERNFRNLWNLGSWSGIHDELEKFIVQMTQDQEWSEIWVAIKMTLFYDRDKLDETRMEKLIRLEQITQPKSLLEETKIFLKRHDLGIYFANNAREIEGSTWRKEHEIRLQDLGKRVSNNLEIISQIGPELFTYRSYMNSSFFGSLTLNSQDPVKLWRVLRDNYKQASDDKNSSIFVSFFEALQSKDPALAESLRNEVTEDPELKHIYPSILNHGPERVDIDRLFQMIKTRSISPHFFSSLDRFTIGNQISEQDFCDLIAALAESRDGYKVAIEIVAGKFSEYRRKSSQISPALLLLGKMLLIMATDPEFMNPNDPMRDLYISEIFAVLPKSMLPEKEIELFIGKFIPQGFEKSISPYIHSGILRVLGSSYPNVLLDTLFTRIGNIDPIENLSLLNSPENIGEIILNVEQDVILSWMEKDLVVRAKFLSRYLPLVEGDQDADAMKWTEFGKVFLSKTNDIPTVLDNIAFRLEPRSSIGHFSLTYKRYLPLFEDDYFDSSDNLTNWRDLKKDRWLKIIKLHENYEDENNNMRAESFEE